MVNINIELPKELHKRLRLQSLQKDCTLKDYVVKLLREEVASNIDQG